MKPLIAPEELPTTGRPHWRALRVVRNEVAEELRAVLRDPTTLFFSAAMPVGFFALFVGLWGAETDGVVTVGTAMLATFGTFGVVGVCLLTPGIGIAEDRDRGWLRVKRVSATPLPVTLAAKVLAAVPHALVVLLAMTAISAATGTLHLDAVVWARLMGALLIGGVPFALVGLTVGLLTSPNGATAVLMALFIPSAVASGLWMPLEMLPDGVQQVAPWLPTYHLAQLALAQMDGRVGLDHVVALLTFAALGAGAATLAYRHAR